MKPKRRLFQARLFCVVALGIGSCFGLPAAEGRDAFHRVPMMADEVRDAVEGVPTSCVAERAPARTSQAIPWSQISAKAGADYQGDGLAVSPSAEGARLRCVFQRLEAEATREGLWLTSTVTNAVNDRFRIAATAVGREVGIVERGALVRRSDALTLYAPLPALAPRLRRP